VDLGPHPLLQLFHLESRPAQQLACTAGRHEPRPALDTAERRDVEVIVMQVRDEDDIDPPRRARRRAVAPEMRDSGAKHRVGEDAHASVLD
jgi:hypothetical protein